MQFKASFKPNLVGMYSAKTNEDLIFEYSAIPSRERLSQHIQSIKSGFSILVRDLRKENHLVTKEDKIIIDVESSLDEVGPRHSLISPYSNRDDGARERIILLACRMT